MCLLPLDFPNILFVLSWSINYSAILSPGLFVQVSMHVLVPEVTLFTFPTLLTTRNDLQEGTHWLLFFLVFALFAIAVVLLVDSVIQLGCNAQPSLMMASVISGALL